MDCKLKIYQQRHNAYPLLTLDYKGSPISVRGVQPISAFNKKEPYCGLSLLAGQRETIAALVTAGKSAEKFQNLFSHGTSYNKIDNHNYQQYFDKDKTTYYQYLTEHTFYNTTPKKEDSLPFTYNLLSSLAYFLKINLARPVAILGPLINIHSPLLMNGSLTTEECKL